MLPLRVRALLDHPRVPSLRLALDVVTATALVACAVVTATVVLQLSITPRLVAVQAMLPVVVAIGVGLALFALVRRRWALAACGTATALATFGLVVPTVVAESAPGWTADARKLTVYSSNLRRSNPSPDLALAKAVESDADVIVFLEYVPAFEPALRRSGLLERYETVVRDEFYDRGLLLTRLPVEASAVVGAGGFEIPSATVLVDDTPVTVFGIHAQSPSQFAYMQQWERNLEGVARAASGHDDVIIVGDFNSGIWNAPFRKLLDWGFVDAHSATGAGLARTWGLSPPGSPASTPILGIDHAVSRGDRVAPLWVSSTTVPGSDHRAIEVTYAVRAAAA